MVRLAAALCVLPLVTFAPFLGGGLLTDDFRHVERLRAAAPADLLTAPDSFQMFRPAMQASLLADRTLGGGVHPAAMRATNLVLHLLVVIAAFVLARELLGDDRPAFLAALGLLLTPKAAAIAVLWISARAELLMSLFAIAALIAWVRWDRRGGAGALAAAGACYLLALFGKETAILLPVLMLGVPFSPRMPAGRRVAAVAGLAAVGALWYVLRAQAGAVVMGDEGQYYMLTTPGRWLRNLQSYAGRGLPAAAAVLAIGGAAALLRRRPGRPGGFSPPEWPHLRFAVLWFLVFMAPVLGIVGRSEIRLYLAGFGFSLAAAAMVWRAIFADTRHAAAAVAILAAALGGYQAFRAAAMHDDLVFSARFVRSLAESPEIRALEGGVAEVGPGDAVTERFLRDAIGGYLPQALRLALGRDDVDGLAPYMEQPQRLAALRLQCVYRGGVVRLTPIRTEYRRP